MPIDLARLADALHGRRMAVIGDALLDVYLQGRVERLCREAPVPQVQIERTRDVPGGAGNVAVNAVALEAQVFFIAPIGDDASGKRLRAALAERGVDERGLVVEPERATPTKHRLLAGDQVVARFDTGAPRAVRATTEQALLDRASEGFAQADVVVLSDYGYGTFTPDMLEGLIALQRRHRRLIVADSRALARFACLSPTAVKPSYGEVLALLGRAPEPAPGGRAEAVAAAAESILRTSGARIAAVTLDIDGAVILERDRPAYRTYARPARAARSTGSGDTYVTALAAALAAGAETPAAAELAAAAAAVVVGKEGTATCSAQELRELMASSDKRVADLATLSERVKRARADGRRIVFTNGCFDILHRGHVTLLNRAKGLGDLLVVGVNSDESVRRLKGATRPINGLDDRTRVLAALSYVDLVASFDGDSPRDLIRAVRPDIYVKGGDYTRENLPEAPLVESLGGAVCILPLVEERSTTGIIARIRTAAAS